MTTFLPVRLNFQLADVTAAFVSEHTEKANDLRRRTELVAGSLNFRSVGLYCEYARQLLVMARIGHLQQDLQAAKRYQQQAVAILSSTQAVGGKLHPQYHNTEALLMEAQGVNVERPDDVEKYFTALSLASTLNADCDKENQDASIDLAYDAQSAALKACVADIIKDPKVPVPSYVMKTMLVWGHVRNGNPLPGLLKRNANLLPLTAPNPDCAWFFKAHPELRPKTAVAATVAAPRPAASRPAALAKPVAASVAAPSPAAPVIDRIRPEIVEELRRYYDSYQPSFGLSEEQLARLKQHRARIVELEAEQAALEAERAAIAERRAGYAAERAAIAERRAERKVVSNSRDFCTIFYGTKTDTLGIDYNHIYNTYIRENNTVSIELPADGEGFVALNCMGSVVQFFKDHPEVKTGDFRIFESHVSDIATLIEYLKTRPDFKGCAFDKSLSAENQALLNASGIKVKYFD